MHAAALLAKLDDLSVDFQGTRVIEASVLQKSWIAPILFEGSLASQAAKAVREQLPADAYFEATKHGRAYRLAPSGGSTCLVKVDKLKVEQLVDPLLVPPPKSKVTKWLSDKLATWAAAPATSIGRAQLPSWQQQVIEFGGAQVIEAGELCKAGLLPALFKNLTKTPRKAVGLRLQQDLDYLVARWDRRLSGYVACKPSVNQAKFLVKLECVTRKMRERPDATEAEAPPAMAVSEPAPVVPYQPELELEECEVLKDEGGQAVPLVCRGERHPRRCYFKVADVGRMLGLWHLSTNLCDATSAHLPGEDFVKMSMVLPSPPPDSGGGDGGQREDGGATELYFTYRGLLRCLFTSRKPVARVFVNWAEEVLFAAHLGTPEQREELAAALVGVSVDIVRQFARQVYAFNMAGVYLLLIGTVADLRGSMGLPNDLSGDLLVLKWGRTEDLDQRLKDHDRQYGSLDGASLRLVYFAPIDPRYQSSAEADAKQSVCEIGTHLTSVRLRGEAKKELVLFDKAGLKVAARHAFQRIGATYAGCLKGMTEELEKQRTLGEQKDLRLEDKERQLAEKDRRLEDKDKHIEDKERHVRQLEGMLADKDQHLRELKQWFNAQLLEKDKQFTQMERMYEALLASRASCP